jgi:hypothetical protein
VSELTLAGDKTSVPGTHVIHFIGEQPCHMDGSEIDQIKNQANDQTLAEGLVINRSFSNKPEGGYTDYYAKITRYVEILSAPAQALDRSVTAKTFKVIEAAEGESVFNYIDTNSSRAEIFQISEKLRNQKIAIIGVGGTGAYVLDLVAKAPAREIHIFDEDRFLQHNAFRAPGAPSLSELKRQPKKVKYFAGIYSKMRKHIYAHDYSINSNNVDELLEMDFVFICIDKGEVKKLIVDKLDMSDIPFIDVGMGIISVNDQLIGILRTTSSTKDKRKHVHEMDRICFSYTDDDDYSTNIQIADLNSLNAAFAVIKWKKLSGYYQDLENEHHSTYTLNVNMLLNEDNDS